MFKKLAKKIEMLMDINVVLEKTRQIRRLFIESEKKLERQIEINSKKLELENYRFSIEMNDLERRFQVKEQEIKRKIEILNESFDRKREYEENSIANNRERATNEIDSSLFEKKLDLEKMKIERSSWEKEKGQYKQELNVKCESYEEQIRLLKDQIGSLIITQESLLDTIKEIGKKDTNIEIGSKAA